MCVKEFYGYNCGHCSVPVLRQCPLSASNPHFPACKFPAERPIFTNEFCHPCSRVVWNSKVLKEEEEHRAAHLREECGCEVIFEGEEREKRYRTRGGKGKGKSSKKDNGMAEQHGDPYGVVDQGSFEQQTAEGDTGGYKPGEGDSEEIWRLGEHMQMNAKEDDSARGGWEPAAQVAAYEYVGYYVNGQDQGTDPEQSYAVALGGGGQAQLPMGEIGSGMRWYPNHRLCSPQQLYPSPYFNNGIEDALHGPRAAFVRAASVPYGRYENPGPFQHADTEVPVLQTQPLVVSSNMMRPEST